MKTVETFYEKNGVPTAQVHIRSTLNDADQLESFDDLPSLQEFDRAGNVMRSVWHDAGIIHRHFSRGPAIIHEDKGKVFWECYYSYGFYHRPQHQGPAYDFANPTTGIRTQTWIEGNRTIKSLTHDKDGSLLDARYYQGGLLHNPDTLNMEPAHFNHKTGKKFYLGGIEFTEAQMREVAKLIEEERKFY